MGRSRTGSRQDAQYLEAARQFGPALERLARGYEADPETRRDLLQEIHSALWRSFGYFEGQCSVRSWIYRVAHNVAISHIVVRKRGTAERLAGLDEVDGLADPGDLEAVASDRRIVERLLATVHRLKPTDRQVMLLYLEDLSAAEIGEITGLSAGAVAVRVHRVKALLTQQFGYREDGQ